jgi:hypothetical protein
VERNEANPKMQEPITYFIDHATGTVELTLTRNRLIAKTQGKGLLDKPRIADIALSDLKHFCLVPTIAIQNLQSPGTDGDYSYDSEFIFSYREGAQLRNKRVFVNGRNQSCHMLLQNLKTEYPGASLLHLEPAEAQKQMGVLSASKAASVVIGLLVGVPILIVLIVIISKILRG